MEKYTVFPRSEATATINFLLLALAATIRGLLLEAASISTLHDSLLFSSINFDSKVLFLVVIIANNNGCGQYALIGVQLQFEGCDYI